MVECVGAGCSKWAFQESTWNPGPLGHRWRQQDQAVMSKWICFLFPAKLTNLTVAPLGSTRGQCPERVHLLSTTGLLQIHNTQPGPHLSAPVSRPHALPSAWHRCNKCVCSWFGTRGLGGDRCMGEDSRQRRTLWNLNSKGLACEKDEK